MGWWDNGKMGWWGEGMMGPLGDGKTGQWGNGRIGHAWTTGVTHSTEPVGRRHHLHHLWKEVMHPQSTFLTCKPICWRHSGAAQGTGL